MNIMSFDIEEWYIEKFFEGNNTQKYQVFDRMLSQILDLLEDHSVKATFFCLGALVEYFPHVIKKIAQRGHEIGCHSNCHLWINKMTVDEFKKDTSEAVERLENCIGQKVESYRAPAFSIGESNKWAFEVLNECGIKNDASIFPGIRDFGGYPSFGDLNAPCKIRYNDIELNEFPISMCTLPVVGKKIAFSGGGYFRVLPLSFVKNQISKLNYVMCYFHIIDLLDVKSKMMNKEEYERYFKEKGSLKNRLTRYFKSNIGRQSAFKGLEDIVANYPFTSISQAAMDSAHFKVIEL